MIIGVRVNDRLNRFDPPQYAYVGGNPILGIDILGLCDCSLKSGAYSDNPLKKNFITPSNVSAANNVANQLGKV